MADIARRLELPHSTIRNYIQHNRLPSADVLVAISNRTNVSIHWLLTGEGSRLIVFDNQFDVERSIVKSGDWYAVIREWYEFEGGEMPEDVAASFMGGWENFTMEQKVNAIKDLKTLLDRTVDRHAGT